MQWIDTTPKEKLKQNAALCLVKSCKSNAQQRSTRALTAWMTV